jgi:RHS repeat-associated protein
MRYHAPSGLYLAKYRVYDPHTGRWLSRDPIEEDGGINLYAYVGGNPLGYIDSTGEAAVATGLGLGAALGLSACIVTPGCKKALDDFARGCIKAITTIGDWIIFNEEACEGGGKCEETNSNGDKDPSTPTGRKGSPIDVAPGTNDPTTIDGRDYTGHALDRMQGRGVPPSAVEDAIRHGQSSPGIQPGTTVNNGLNGVTVVTGDQGQVITVIPK